VGSRAYSLYIWFLHVFVERVSRTESFSFRAKCTEIGCAPRGVCTSLRALQYSTVLRRFEKVAEFSSGMYE